MSFIEIARMAIMTAADQTQSVDSRIRQMSRAQRVFARAIDRQRKRIKHTVWR